MTDSGIAQTIFAFNINSSKTAARPQSTSATVSDLNRLENFEALSIKARQELFSVISKRISLNPTSQFNFNLASLRIRPYMSINCVHFVPNVDVTLLNFIKAEYEYTSWI